MTRLTAKLKDFVLTTNGDGSDHTYSFRFGFCEDFHDTFAQFRTKIAAQDRTAFPKKDWLWEVRGSNHNYMILSDLFDNFISSYEAAKLQLSLFR